MPEDYSQFVEKDDEIDFTGANDNEPPMGSSQAVEDDIDFT